MTRVKIYKVALYALILWALTLAYGFIYDHLVFLNFYDCPLYTTDYCDWTAKFILVYVVPYLFKIYLLFFLVLLFISWLWSKFFRSEKTH